MCYPLKRNQSCIEVELKELSASAYLDTQQQNTLKSSSPVSSPAPIQVAYIGIKSIDIHSNFIYMHVMFMLLQF